MLRPPRRSTLFPYTTLFRSVPALLGDLGQAYHGPGHPTVLPAGSLQRQEPVVRLVEADRKSTRLNSSHLGISYAVFCLKKKNNLAVVSTIGPCRGQPSKASR